MECEGCPQECAIDLEDVTKHRERGLVRFRSDGHNRDKKADQDEPESHRQCCRKGGTLQCNEQAGADVDQAGQTEDQEGESESEFRECHLKGDVLPVADDIVAACFARHPAAQQEISTLCVAKPLAIDPGDHVAHFHPGSIGSTTRCHINDHHARRQRDRHPLREFPPCNPEREVGILRRPKNSHTRRVIGKPTQSLFVRGERPGLSLSHLNDHITGPDAAWISPWQTFKPASPRPGARLCDCRLHRNCQSHEGRSGDKEVFVSGRTGHSIKSDYRDRHQCDGKQAEEESRKGRTRCQEFHVFRPVLFISVQSTRSGDAAFCLLTFRAVTRRQASVLSLPRNRPLSSVQQRFSSLPRDIRCSRKQLMTAVRGRTTLARPHTYGLSFGT